jgi:hypothetical protein
MGNSMFQSFSRFTRRHALAFSLAGTVAACGTHDMKPVKSSAAATAPEPGPPVPVMTPAIPPSIEFSVNYGEVTARYPDQGIEEIYDFQRHMLVIERRDPGGIQYEYKNLDEISPAKVAFIWDKRRELNGGQDYAVEHHANGSLLDIFDQKTGGIQTYDFARGLYYPEGMTSPAHTLRFDQIDPGPVDAAWTKLLALNNGASPDLTPRYLVDEETQKSYPCDPDPDWPPRDLTDGERRTSQKWYAGCLDENRAFIQFCANAPPDRVADMPVMADGWRIYGRENFSRDYSKEVSEKGFELQAINAHEGMHSVQNTNGDLTATTCTTYDFWLAPKTEFRALCNEQQATAMGAASLLSNGFERSRWLGWFRNWNPDASERSKNKARALLRDVISQAFPHLSNVNLGEDAYAVSGDALTKDIVREGARTHTVFNFSSRTVHMTQTDPGGAVVFDQDMPFQTFNPKSTADARRRFVGLGGVLPK